MSQSTSNITHMQGTATFEDCLANLKLKIEQRGDLSYISVQEQLRILEEMTDFEFGRFLIQSRGLNGFWTDYILKHPAKGRQSGLNSENKPFSDLEHFSWIKPLQL